MTRRPRLDQSTTMLAQGYAWLPDRRRAAGRDTVRTRVALRPTLGVEGPAATRCVQDEDHVRRRTRCWPRSPFTATPTVS